MCSVFLSLYFTLYTILYYLGLRYWRPESGIDQFRNKRRLCGSKCAGIRTHSPKMGDVDMIAILDKATTDVLAAAELLGDSLDQWESCDKDTLEAWLKTASGWCHDAAEELAKSRVRPHKAG